MLPPASSAITRPAPMSRNDFNNLTRRTFRGPPGTPWWFSLIFQVVVFVAIAFAIAWGLDWFWVHLLGREAFAVCGLVGWIPIGSLMHIGIIIFIGGFLTLLARAARPALLLMLIGVVLYSTPNELLRLGYGGSCKVPGTVSAKI
ncbi:hypothetical protein [Aestuariivirga litoralis]|uniref:hypothetical protein n=1 Tax=Aestuariivirga litoralis TaxID=2650924 RepID=UPI0018C6B831|nr:hypothetical protein [Aestuariivirga litoralis]MBG1233970.1 hypothetical protein [Aestuariivirga litoralis]